MQYKIILMNKAIFWKECLERVVANVFNCLLEVPEVRRKSLITSAIWGGPLCRLDQACKKALPCTGNCHGKEQ